MKKLRMAFFLIALLCFVVVSSTSGHDTDLYMATGQGVEPNILIIFDNSGSMNDEVISCDVYDPNLTYDPYVVGIENSGKVYYRTSSGGWSTFKDTIAQVACANARTALTNTGHWEGPTSSSCSSSSRTLRTGNYRNFLECQDEGGGVGESKLTAAKRVVKEFLDTVNGVRVGFMIYNNNEGGKIHSTIRSLDDTTRAQLKSDVTAIVGNTWTPLGETLYEAGLYFKGGSSYFNAGTVYTSPIQYSCQRNYVIMVTDGIPTQDRNNILKTAIGDRDGDGREPGGANEVYYENSGSDYLDDVAKYLYETDLSTSFDGQQNITTYVIGFAIQSSLLERAATHGHGRYYYCYNAQSLANVFQNIIGDILAKSTSFVAPIVPVSRMERTSAGDKIYLALFKPEQYKMWSGNIKKFGVAQADDPSRSIVVGDILDANGNRALDSMGHFYNTARSYWTTKPMDGGEVEEGGVGEKLLERNFSSDPRKIYTYFGTHVDLTHDSNKFRLENADITPELLGLGVGNTAGRNNLIKFVHGIDVYDENANGNITEKRDWVLGSFLHSRPFIIHYSSRSVIYAGGNDGMVHAFDDADGSELWGFIPPNLFTKLQALSTDQNEAFVDGSPRAYIEYDSSGYASKAILIFGLRRGGNEYYALDVTNPLVPKYLWKINPSSAGFGELAQTWSAPLFGKINDGSADGRVVAFIGAGYDDNQDNDNAGEDSKGRGIYVINVLDGSQYWRYTYAENNTMKYSIPSDIARVDLDGDGKIDRLYAGSMGGRLWRFDIEASDKASWTGKIIFDSNPGESVKRKFFYPPDVTLENDAGEYEMLFLGTGDREHPKNTTIVNRIYAVKDRNLTDQDPVKPYDETVLVDVTTDLLQTGTADEKTAVLQELKQKKGWFIRLSDNSGEKSLAPPVVFFKTVYFTTFSPTIEGGGEADPCFVGEGTARIYAVKYNTGESVFNLDVTNDVGGTSVYEKSDRSTVIGTAIPSGVIVTFIGGKAVAYSGVGGGVYSPSLSSKKSFFTVNWKIVF